MKKEYCYKAVINEEYVLFLGCPFGLWHVFVANKDVTGIDHTYSVYGGYKNIGTAANRLLKSAQSYQTNPVKLYYTTKENVIKYGAFGIKTEEKK